MSVIFLLIPLSILIATAFLCAFIWAIGSGQYEDTTTPAMRLLLDETSVKHLHSPGSSDRPSAKGGRARKEGADAGNRRVVQAAPPGFSESGMKNIGNLE